MPEKKEFTTPFDAEFFGKHVPKDALILDVGCGYGRTIKELHGNAYKNLTGADFSEKMIGCAKRSFPFADFYITSGDKTPFADKSFDCVLLFAVLTCIINDIEQENLVQEISRVLKPEGIIYVNDFFLNTDVRNITRYNAVKNKYGKYGVFELAEGAVLRHHNEEYIKNLLSVFEVITFEKKAYDTMNGNKTNGFSFLGKNKV